MLGEKQISKIRKSFNGADQRIVFKALADTNRYRIFQMLHMLPQLAVSEMAKILEISIPLTSQHLKVLENAKILQKERDGQKIYYRLMDSNKIVQSITKIILKLKGGLEYN